MKRAVGERRQLRKAGSEEDSVSERTKGSKRRVLLVEDDFLVANDVEHAMKQHGYEVVGIAVAANEAIDMARSHRPDLIVMDIRLKGGTDGVEAATEIFKELGIRSIFATAHADSSTRERASSASPLAWLQKPYSSRALLHLIDNALPR